MQPSPYTHTFTSPHTTDVALYHSLTMEIAYCTAEKYHAFEVFATSKGLTRTSDETIQQFINPGFLVSEGGQEQGYIQQVVANIQPDISVMYLLLTDNCNLRCKYCTVQYNLQEAELKAMDAATISKSLQLFQGLNTSNRKRNITFFGGEPLLNLKGLRFALQEIDRLFGPDEVNLFIVTNGTAITDEVATLLSRHQVFPIVSMDGWEEIHDRMRVYGDNKGSFKDTRLGYNRLKEKGLEVGISTLVGKHNCHQLPEIVSFFIHELKAFNSGMSLAHVKPEAADIPIEILTPLLIESWQIARDNNFYIMQIGKRLKALAVQKPNLRSCPGSAGWSMIRILPDGTITLCENMGLRSKAVLGNVNDSLSPETVVNHPDTVDWNNRYPYNIDTCLKCPAIGICGGGCPYDAFLQTGSIHEPEPRSCYLSKHLLEWAIWDIRKRVDMSQGVGIPTPADRQGILPRQMPYFV